MKKSGLSSRVASRNISTEKDELALDDQQPDLSLSRSQSPVLKQANGGSKRAESKKTPLEQLDTSADRPAASAKNLDMRKIFGEVQIKNQKEWFSSSANLKTARSTNSIPTAQS